jgi:hypothetical protein
MDASVPVKTGVTAEMDETRQSRSSALGLLFSHGEGGVCCALGETLVARPEG